MADHPGLRVGNGSHVAGGYPQPHWLLRLTILSRHVGSRVLGGVSLHSGIFLYEARNGYASDHSLCRQLLLLWCWRTDRWRYIQNARGRRAEAMAGKTSFVTFSMLPPFHLHSPLGVPFELILAEPSEH